MPESTHGQAGQPDSAQLEGVRGEGRRVEPESDATRGDEALARLASGLEMLRVVSEELNARNEALAVLRRSYQELFANSLEGRLITDAEGVIQEANAAAASLLDRAPGALTGHALSLYVDEDARRPFLRRLALFCDGIAEDTPWRVPCVAHGRKTVTVELRLSAHVDRNGRPRRIYWALIPTSDAATSPSAG